MSVDPMPPTVWIRGTCPHGHTHTFPARLEHHTPSDGQGPDLADSSQPPVAGLTLTCQEHNQPASWWVATPDLPQIPPERLQQLAASRSQAHTRYQAARDRLAVAILAEVSHRILGLFPTAALLRAQRQPADLDGDHLHARALIDIHGHFLADNDQEAASLEVLSEEVDGLLDAVAALSPGSDSGEVQLKVNHPAFPPSPADRDTRGAPG